VEKAMRWVEERIQKAIEAGEFENLRGKGQRIEWDENPFAPPEWQLAFHLLRSNGFTLPWIETRRELLAEMAELRCQTARLRETPPTDLRRGEESAQLEKKIGELNQRIRRYNISAPLAHFQLPVLDCKAELEGSQ
jgi:DnaJ family protein C protein 28